ncbi:hypothetical protein GCM10007978_26530 [Shewanella hanedai]|nr:hypothetical protein GCM10007978_26530 [Shewanella hanedai]
MPVDVSQKRAFASVESRAINGKSDVLSSNKMAGMIAKIVQPKIIGAIGERIVVEGAFKDKALWYSL